MKPGRVLSLQVRIVEPKECAWIWDCHREGSIFQGIWIEAIQEGELPQIEDEDEEDDY